MWERAHVDEEVKKLEPSDIVGGNVTWVQELWKNSLAFPEKVVVSPDIPL